MSWNFADYKFIDIPEGRVKRITDQRGQVLWVQGYTNQVPISTDTDGSIYNKTGYKDNTHLSSSGGVSSSAQSGSTTTGFIPFPNGDATVIRMKGVEWKNSTANYGGHYYINFCDSSKKFLAYLSASEAPGVAHVVTIEIDSNGVESVVWNQSYGTTNSLLQYVRKDAKYIRINARGKGADMIVTIDEEIVEGYTNLADASVTSTAPTSNADTNWWLGYRINSSKNAVAWDADGVVTNLIRIRDDNGNMLINDCMHIKGLDCKTDGNFHFYDKSGAYSSYSGGVSSNAAVSYADYDSSVITVTPVFLYPSSKEYFVRIQGHLMGGAGTSNSVVITADERIV